MLNKDNDILNSLSDLDLSPTMEKNARDKYGALCKYLNEQGLDSDFQPQGSFLIGTAIKRNKDETSAERVKNDVGNLIKESGIYADKLKKEDRNCWTLKYAEVSNGIGFSLDVVPAVDEIDDIKNEIILSGVDVSKAKKTVAITDKKDFYEWLSSNPLGFGDWFMNISNMNLTSDMKAEQYKSMPSEIRMAFVSVEEIPTYYYRSNLQRAVQFIKRHRDIYYDRSNLRDDKPSSILISALVADCVKDKCFLSVSEIIKSFVNGYKNKSISIMQNGKVLNPVDLRENLIGKYTKERLEMIESWIEVLSKFIYIEDGKKFRQTIHNDINTNIFTNSFDTPKKIIEPAKPWMK